MPIMQKLTQDPNRLKYVIGAKLSELPEFKRIKVRKEILRRCKTTNSTFSRWINATWEDSQDIPGAALKEISDILLVPVDDLYNQKP